jgi:hypothetical protein
MMLLNSTREFFRSFVFFASRILFYSFSYYYLSYNMAMIDSSLEDLEEIMKKLAAAGMMSVVHILSSRSPQ